MKTSASVTETVVAKKFRKCGNITFSCMSSTYNFSMKICQYIKGKDGDPVVGMCQIVYKYYNFVLFNIPLKIYYF